MTDFDRAVVTWVARKMNIPEAEITDVQFDQEAEGYCETCWSTSVALSFSVGGKEHYHRLYEKPGDFVREVAAIALEQS